MTYDLEWENYIGKLFSRLTKNYYYTPQTVIELLPGFCYKGAIMLRDMNFTGTIFVIDENKKVCKFVEEEYKKFIPKAKIITICKRMDVAISYLPENIDLLIGNHCIDDLILSEFLNLKNIKILPANKNAIKKCWNEIENSPILLENIYEKIHETFYNLFRTRNINFTILSQYKSNIYLTENFVYDISKKLFNEIKYFINEEDSGYFLKNIRPFDKDERYLLPSLLSNAQNSDNWIIGKPKKEITTIFNILKDPYYSILYKRCKDINLCFKSGFIDNASNISYNTNILTTPLNKIKINEKIVNPVVILSTGGFNPIHNGHISMIKKAKDILEANGYNCIGAFLSPSHESYVSTKENYIDNQFDRLNYNYKILEKYDWINIDTWESLCNDKLINFTVVIDRLEKYLRHFVRSDIKVAYVCGDDNIYFMNVFKEKGLGVCIERNNPEFDVISREIFSPNIFYVKGNASKDSSKTMRKFSQDIDYKGTYIIRNEGILPFKNINISNQTKIKAQAFFKKNFYKIFKKYIPINTKIIDIEDEVKYADKKLKNKNTLSIDPFYTGKYNINISRKFYFADGQITNKSLIESPFNNSIDMQINSLPKESFTLVDDDSISGKTIKLLKEKIEIKDVYLLSNIIKEDIFDAVDLRDFIFGVNESGLVVDFFGQNIRIPYVYPYVNLYTRANIKDTKGFSKEIIELNISMYESFFPDLRVNDLDDSFKILCQKQDVDTNLKVYKALKELFSIFF